MQSLTRLFVILVSLMMSLFSEKMLIFNRCISGLMSNLIEKSWTVSIATACCLKISSLVFNSTQILLISVTSVVEFSGRTNANRELIFLLKKQDFFYLTSTDFQLGRQKVPKSDFQSHFSMSKIISISLKNVIKNIW